MTARGDTSIGSAIDPASDAASDAAIGAITQTFGRFTIDERNSIAPIEVAHNGEVAIRCGAGVHRARVVDGALVLESHDLEAELPLLVFGSDVPRCLVYLAAWHQSLTDQFLAEWAADTDGEQLAHAREEWYGNYWENWPSEPSAGRALFGPRLQRQLAVGAARRWITTRGPDGPGAGWQAVRRSVTTRARRSVVASFACVHAHRRPDALVPVSIEAVTDGDPAVEGRLAITGSWVRIRLPVRWLWRVWAPGRSVSHGHFVVDADEAGRALLVVRWRPTGGPQREHTPALEHL